ncbi:ABC-2 type transport system ATP-binding protein [Pilibacter termitis]|uniref:ABC-2 type transport system ATP-binding protein n=1 Tax=Pilibacter termitis TaxID=263852 RepID=A0A1T4M0J7_9ENTE|nr:ABC transporter ATP-binding protein [Pilibacter termitis]SJZ60530.1 ABC-2 type transport system ATP-binding protein [Pilibacter termitis]
MSEIFLCENLSKTYGKHVIFENLNFSIRQGEIFVVLGKNGAGKSTLIKILLGMIKASSGAISYRGEKVKTNENFYRNVSAVLESVENVYPFLSGWENIRYFLSMSGKTIQNEKERMNELIERFNMKEAIHKPVGTYSRGMQQKLAIICCLARNTETIFLDEPTLGLDFEANQEMMNIISDLAKKEKKTIILTSHQADVLDNLSDTVLLLNNHKQLYCGKYKEFIKQYKPQSFELQTVQNNIVQKKTFPTSESASEELSKLLHAGHTLLEFHEREKTIEDILLEVYSENN